MAPEMLVTDWHRLSAWRVGLKEKRNMRHRVIPTLAPATKSQAIGDGCYGTNSRRLAVLNSPMLNNATAFSALERKELGLAGLLPPEIGTLRTQVRRAYIQYERLPDALSKNTFRTTLHDRNELRGASYGSLSRSPNTVRNHVVPKVL